MNTQIRNIACAILHKDGKVLLQHREEDNDRFPGQWCAFGGGIEKGETPEEAVRRELIEELEYRLQAPRLIHEHQAGPTWGAKYLYLEQYDETQPLIQHEGQGMRWVGPEEWKTLDIIENERPVLEGIFQKFLQ